MPPCRDALFSQAEVKAISSPTPPLPTGVPPGVPVVPPAVYSPPEQATQPIDDKLLLQQMHDYLTENETVLKQYFIDADKDKNGGFVSACALAPLHQLLMTHSS